MRRVANAVLGARCNVFCKGGACDAFGVGAAVQAALLGMITPRQEHSRRCPHTEVRLKLALQSALCSAFGLMYFVRAACVFGVM